ncbi:M48 family metallopeptidase [Parashewanella tropica]|uniref:M48 family metallopeptidase n=1 Tax=Parashewanella tropica TaxID=2547970 RepID=UPI00105A985A|nr:M48 family metallopeptidase [Parashewanella tropica]
MLQVRGKYQLAESAQFRDAIAKMNDQGFVRIIDAETLALITDANTDAYRYSDVIPSLPTELLFHSGCRFIPDLAEWTWPTQHSKSKLLAWLETRWTVVLASLIIIPAFMWVMTTKILPAAADAAVPLLPEVVAKKTGQQTLTVMDRTLLKPSQLTIEEQNKVDQLWQQVLKTTNDPLVNTELQFRDSAIGANAMALPDGTVIVTDDIVKLMEKHPDALQAVLLHEIGHVHHQHGMKQLARSTAITMLFALMLGDIEGAGEMVIGAGASLLQSSFSRDMETQADEYAYLMLPKLGKSKQAFAKALTLLAEAHGEELSKGKVHHWLEYLQSHPDIEKRISNSSN